MPHTPARRHTTTPLLPSTRRVASTFSTWMASSGRAKVRLFNAIQCTLRDADITACCASLCVTRGPLCVRHRPSRQPADLWQAGSSMRRSVSPRYRRADCRQHQAPRKWDVHLRVCRTMGNAPGREPVTRWLFFRKHDPMGAIRSCGTGHC